MSRYEQLDLLELTDAICETAKRIADGEVINAEDKLDLAEQMYEVRQRIEHGWGKPNETTKGSCPTRGILIGFHELVEIVWAYGKVDNAPPCPICEKPMPTGRTHYGCARGEG